MTIDNRDSALDLQQLGSRVRILTGVESTEIGDSDLSELISMASEWFESQSGLTYAVNTEDAYDNAVIFYTSYLLSIAQNGMGVENLTEFSDSNLSKKNNIQC